ncbi:hypothetical protein [Psychromonas ossibalaenae]|uniref:hypothetical protein n=1 Tax=Psychromonas ossibalaenae TaxID=444922 RepID=UPI0003801AD4|nr:hypothetical protein [Psychromonas ossibalaenae]
MKKILITTALVTTLFSAGVFADGDLEVKKNGVNALATISQLNTSNIRPPFDTDSSVSPICVELCRVSSPPSCECNNSGTNPWQ